MRFKPFAALALAAALCAAGSPAQAAAVVWVSATGSDTNTCHPADPCATFAHAISTTSGASEVDCVTPGNFANTGLVISSAVTINCPGGVIVGGVSVGTSSGVVILRGIEIQGLGAGVDGLDFNGGTLVLDNVKINGFSGGIGLNIQGSGAVSVTNSQFSNNSNGIVVEPPSGTGLVSLSQVDVENNFNGILIGIDATSGESAVTLVDSVVANNAGVGINVTGSGAGQFLEIKHSSIVSNNSDGLFVDGSGAFALIGDSIVAWNGTGITSVSGGTTYSYRNNQINGNDRINHSGVDISGPVYAVGLQ
jgi:hypothetical protein